MISKLRYILFVLSIACFVSIGQSQDSNIKLYTLSDGTPVKAIIVSNKGQIKAYYLPANLRVAMDKSNRQQISLTKYKKDGGSGSVFHALLTWGLTKSQSSELQQCLNESMDQPIKLYGSHNLNNGSELLIEGNGIVSDMLRRASKDMRMAPINPGQKMALSAKLNAAETKAMDKFIRNNATDKKTTIKIDFDYNYKASNGQLRKDTHSLKDYIKNIF